jgi:hypothetical protein
MEPERDFLAARNMILGGDWIGDANMDGSTVVEGPATSDRSSD